VNVVTSASDEAAWPLPSTAKTGMFGLIAAESAIFVIFIVAYAFYIGKTTNGPTPAVLSPPIFLSVCLLSSSATMELALRALGRGATRVFSVWWVATFILGAIFLGGTALEWRHLIVDEGLTISTNLFGTTYYSLVGLHAFHVTVGLILIAATAAFALSGRVNRSHLGKLEIIGLYWHFVDTVWVAVFTLVYLVGR
jgi:cytochrome c oxidase subunit 3/cytochrome o ubiquinol oxidase subunit 3